MNLIPRNFFLDDDFDNFFFSSQKKNDMKCDIFEKDNIYHIEMDLPGYEKKDINIEVKDGHLNVKAARSNSEEEENKNYIRRERSYGEYQRSFALGDIDQDKIEAKFDQGILLITVPKQEIVDNKKMIDIK